MGALLTISVSLVLLGFTSLASYFFWCAWLMPVKIRRSLRRQGIRGPPPSFFFGNLRDVKRIALAAERARQGGTGRGVVHDHPATLFPHITLWRKEYGNTFFYSNGNMVTLYVGDLDLVREICLCSSLDLGKPRFVGRNQGALLGKGILSSNGHAWAVQRRIITPEFAMEKVKGMVDLMAQSTIPLLESWAAKVELEGGAADIRVDEALKSVAADVISRSCFGSSYAEGEEIFSKIRALQKALAAQSNFIGIPGLRYLPIQSNREIWRLARDIKALIFKVVTGRESGAAVDQELLHSLHRSAPCHGPVADDFVVDNCKNIYFAGHETVATMAKWVLVLLASNPEWQARVRREVVEVCNGDMPCADMLRRMTLLTMVIQETLRLYPPSPTIIREALREMRFGRLRVPRGTLIWISRIALLHDPCIWGPTAGEFDPGRFAQGVSGACMRPYVYNPFGIGPRTCPGQHFAMVELKVVLSMILSRFAVSLSPSYRHSVVHRLVMEPEHGVDLVVTRV